jgi:type II secretory pathway pseudopilin PulG
MRRFRNLIRYRDDEGFGMAEVIVALMVFTVIALGMAAALMSMTRLVGDNRNREIAAGLAAQEIDRLRAVTDPFSVHTNSTQTQTVGNTTFTIDREVSWVSTTGSTANCGGGGGVLQYKRVNVNVTWPGQQTLVSPVESDTILAPATRINDPSLGTILVSVLGADGRGRSGVGVTITPTSGGAAVGSVAATDSDGCTYVLKVTPGTYSVQINKAAYIDVNQIASPSFSLTVAAGSSQTANFQYDQQASFGLKYANGFTPTPVLPTGVTTNFISATGNFPTTSTATPRLLFPFPQGYAAFTGLTTNCLSVDPSNWAAGQVKGVNMAAGVRSQIGVAPGSTGTLPVPMGVVAVTVPSGATSFSLIGAAAPSGTGDPGCVTPATYKYSFSSAPAAGSTVYLAVPYGSYTVNSVNALGASTAMSAGFTPSTQGELTGSVITFDPRVPS